MNSTHTSERDPAARLSGAEFARAYAAGGHICKHKLIDP